MSNDSLNLAPVPIQLRGCGKHFGGQRVLDQLDLDIGAGETVVLCKVLPISSSSTMSLSPSEHNK